MIFLKTYADLTPAQKLKLLPLMQGVTQTALTSVELLAPESNIHGAKTLHHASVSFLMGLGFQWHEAVSTASSRLGKAFVSST